MKCISLEVTQQPGPGHSGLAIPWLVQYTGTVDEPWKTFPVGALISYARSRAGLTQAELAARAGTSQANVARYERARSLPRVDTLDRLVRACGFELRMGIEPYDDHDDALIDDQLARTVEERLEANRRMGVLAHAFEPVD